MDHNRLRCLPGTIGQLAALEVKPVHSRQCEGRRNKQRLHLRSNDLTDAEVAFYMHVQEKVPRRDTYEGGLG